MTQIYKFHEGEQNYNAVSNEDFLGHSKIVKILAISSLH